MLKFKKLQHIAFNAHRCSATDMYRLFLKCYVHIENCVKLKKREKKIKWQNSINRFQFDAKLISKTKKIKITEAKRNKNHLPCAMIVNN